MTVLGPKVDSGPQVKTIDINRRKFALIDPIKGDVTYRAQVTLAPKFPFNWLPSEAAQSLGLCRVMCNKVIKEV